MECGIQGTLADAKCIPGYVADALLDAPAVIRAKGERLENQQVEGALEVLSLSHPLISCDERSVCPVSGGCQQISGYAESEDPRGQ